MISTIQELVKVYKDFTLFVSEKWRASAVAIIFIILLGGIFLTIFYGYKKIEAIGHELNRSLSILEDTHTTPDALQRGFVQSVEEGIMIEAEMSKCVYSFGADAMMTFKFHNSKTDLQGKHDFFYSATNEIINTEKDFRRKSMLPDIQNTPVVRLGTFIVPFLDGDCQEIVVSEINGNPWLRDRMENQKINTVFACPVYDYKEHLLGFTELIYLEETEVPTGERKEEVLSSFKNITSRISSIMAASTR